MKKSPPKWRRNSVRRGFYKASKSSPAEGGAGDNPYFIGKMRAFFEANADILVLESYFSEPTTSLANSIWEPDQNPRSSAEYARLW